MILNADNNTTSQRHFQFRTQGAKLSCLIFFVNSSTTVNLMSLSNVTNGSWHHVACTYDGNAMRLYIDGVMDNSVAETRAMNVASPILYIGQYWSMSTVFSYTGLISHVGLWNRALSDSEITDLMQR
ncbi:MAG: LamG domain-containing protein [Bdellovibrionales bacterium]|nr:LamG domain-containing protein [Bdellovibrionales bacterium]